MQWVSLFLTGRFALKRIWIYCGKISQVNVASLHITLFGQGPFWSMYWLSFQANLPVFDRADLLCFHKVCNLIESVLQSQNKIHKDKPWYQTNQLRRDGNLGMTFLVLTVHEACYQVWNHSESVYILQVLVAVSAWFWTSQSLALLSRQGQVGPIFFIVLGK